MFSFARWHDALRHDVAYAIRGLRRDYRFSLAVIATLALGIGANAALFSLAERLFLRQPTGVSEPDHLRRLYRRTNWTVGSVTEIGDAFSYIGFATIRDALAPRARAAAYTPPDSFRIGDDEHATFARGVYASHELLPLLGAKAEMGRSFDAGEDQPDSPERVAVIGHRLWQTRFHGDASILGRVETIARQRYTIVGVMPSNFVGVDLDPVDVWVPLATYPVRPNPKSPWYKNWRSGSSFRVLVRESVPSEAWISSVATTAFRQGELANVKRQPDTATVLSGPLLAALGPSLKPKPEVAIATRLAGVVVMVLLIACANVANLLLARALNRRREFAVRIALGVSTRRLIALPMLEGAILGLTSAGAALLLAVWGGVALQHMVLPVGDAPGAILDWSMIGFALGIALITGVAASVAPAWQAVNPNLTQTLRGGARDGGGNRSRLRSTLVVAQAALSVVLLIGAGLFVRSLRSASAIELGLDARRLVSGSVAFFDPTNHFLDRSSHFLEVGNSLRAVAPRIAALAGVERAALATAPPLAGYAMAPLYLAGGRDVPRIDDLDPALISTSSSYFATVGLRLVRGRTYTDADNVGSERVVVVNEVAARTYWPGEDPIGKCLNVLTKDAPCSRVIGVVADAHYDDLIENPKVGVFVSAAQHPESPLLGNPIFVIARTAPGMNARVANELRQLLRETFPRADPPQIQFTSDRVADELKPWRLGASLFSIFGALAVVVAALGIYSVIAYSVAKRTHELGVRIALGARSADVLSLVTREGVRLVAFGVGIGIACSLMLARFIQSMLYGVSARDPIVIATVASVLTVVAAIAALIPARRAARVDAAVVLRAE